MNGVYDESYEGVYFWETPDRFRNLGLSEQDCDMVLQGANDDVADWRNIRL